jgi:hypothetical protein
VVRFWAPQTALPLMLRQRFKDLLLRQKFKKAGQLLKGS